MKTAIKYIAIFIVLALVFIFGFMVRVDKNVVGPRSTEEVDDLKIQECYWDVASNSLVLVTGERWTRVDLRQAPGEIFVRWKDFTFGKPSADQMSQLKPVAIDTKHVVRYGFFNEPIAPIPQQYAAALYLSAAQMAADNINWFKAYILVTPTKSISFLFDPNSTNSVSLKPPGILLFIFGPSYLALCIALPLTFSNTRKKLTAILFTLAFILHGISFLIYAVLLGMGEAWSGQGGYHDYPAKFMIVGTVVLICLACIKAMRTVRPST